MFTYIGNTLEHGERCARSERAERIYRYTHIRNSRAMALPMPFVPPVTTTLRGVRGDLHTRFIPNWFRAAYRPPTAIPVTAAGPTGYPTQQNHRERITSKPPRKSDFLPFRPGWNLVLQRKKNVRQDKQTVRRWAQLILTSPTVW